MGLKLFVSPEMVAGTGKLSGALAKLAAAVQARRRSASPRRPTSAAGGTETDNLRIADVRPLLPPAMLLEESPRSAEHAEVVRRGRAEVSQILSGQSDRLLILCGPAVVDAPAAALEYAARLAALSRELSSELLVVMRCEIFTPVSPSSGPWPGLLFDPAKDGSYQINKGIRECRELMLQIAQLGLPIASEFRETITPQFFGDLLSWAAVEGQSENLKELVSGLSTPVGLRARATVAEAEEDVSSAEAALAYAQAPRHFLGVTAHGLAGIVESTGNRDSAIVLGGGAGSGAQRAGRVMGACAAAEAVPIVAECGSRGAIDLDQMAMATEVARAVRAGKPAPVGLSLSSYLLAGAQPKGEMSIHGLSITDPCMDWLATQQALQDLASAVRERRAGGGGGANGAAKKRPREA